MSTMRICPKCMAAIPADAPEGACPKCLLNAGFETNSGLGPTPGGRFIPPEPAELAPHFPQLEILEVLAQAAWVSCTKRANELSTASWR
jgi:hypothetical protein